MPDIRKANFLGDEASQILALSDALAAEHGPNIAAAFDDVARTRGLAQLAADAGVAVADLCDALADPRQLNRAVLQHVVATLIQANPMLRG